jgi:LysR family nitrogen assimilation transcriptional regulator
VPLGRRDGAIRSRDLAELPLIMPSLPHNNRRVVEQAAAHHGDHLRVVLEADSVVLTKALVRQGLGYSILTYASVQDEVVRGELRAFPIERPPLISTLALASLRDTKNSRTARDLAGTVRAVLRDLVDQGRWRGGEIVVDRQGVA